MLAIVFLNPVVSSIAEGGGRVDTGDPFTLIIIRHGEKPESPEVDNGSLTMKGLEAAIKLPDQIERIQVDGASIGALNVIFAASLTNGEKTKHARMFQTVTPLSVRNNLPINTKFEIGQEAKLAKWILSSDQRTSLVCWEHNMISTLLNGLGMQTVDWNKDDFNSIIVVRRYEDGHMHLWEFPHRLQDS